VNNIHSPSSKKINLAKELSFALILGINSGIVYAFLVSTTTTYFTDQQLPISTIGFLSVKTIPYSFKYLWSPLIDNYSIGLFPKNFGLRKSWIILMQILLVITIGCFHCVNIRSIPILTLYLTFIAIIGATYDTAMEAYRIESLSKNSGIANTCVIYGFRLGFTISSVFAVLLSDIIDWKYVFPTLALLILLCMIAVFLSEEKIQHLSDVKTNKNQSFVEKFTQPITLLFRRKDIFLLIITISLYKVGDAYLDTMLVPFLVEVGFSKNQIGGIAKSCGIVGAFVGSLIGIRLIARCEILLILFYTEILASLTNLQFLIFLKKNNVILLGLATFLENVSQGMSNVILISFMSSLCDKRYIAAHYAIFTSISSFSRSLISPTSGMIVKILGWHHFFVISSLLSIPSIFSIYLLYWCHNNINKNK